MWRPLAWGRAAGLSGMTTNNSHVTTICRAINLRRPLHLELVKRSVQPWLGDFRYDPGRVAQNPFEPEGVAVPQPVAVLEDRDTRSRS